MERRWPEPFSLACAGPFAGTPAPSCSALEIERRAGGARYPPHHNPQDIHVFRVNLTREICAHTPWRLARYRVVPQAGRALPSQASPSRNKRRSERSSRCAAGGARYPPHHNPQDIRVFRANLTQGICAHTPWRLARYRVVPQGGRALPSQASLARNKRRSSRCAARAALDIRPTTTPKTYMCFGPI